MVGALNNLFSSISFRDPAGRIFDIDGRIIRVVKKDFVDDLDFFLSLEATKALVESCQLVKTSYAEAEKKELLIKIHQEGLINEGLVVEHERIPFQTFPYEWPPEMLYAAGCLNIEISEKYLSEGIALKDATPYNVLFRGPRPVFIDILSFEKRQLNDPVWLPFAQFIRSFFLPLLVNKYFNIPLNQIFITRRDGIEPEEVYDMCGPFRRFTPPFLTWISIPTWLSSRQKNSGEKSLYEKKALNDSQKAQYILGSIFKNLRGAMDRVRPVNMRNSAWSDYYQASKNNYSRKDFDAKQAFIEDILRELSPKKVLDVGCNTGHFSTLAAKAGAEVVAIDYDPSVVGEVWRKAFTEKLDILPLNVNLARPSPGIGWNNRECPSFMERARDYFDAVFMLAVIHHMMVSELIPLDEVIRLAADLTTDTLVVEFIPSRDPMFRSLARGRDHLFKEISRESFEQVCQKFFNIIKSQELEDNGRCMYLMRKKTGSCYGRK